MKFSTHPARLLAALLGAAGVLLAAGCASTVVDASWRDAQLTPGFLRGAKVMVTCEAQDLVLQRICQDQMGAELRARGVIVLPPPAGLQVSGAPSEIDPRVLQAARSAGVKAVFGVTVAASAQAVSQGMAISIGGFGFGGGGGGAGVGVSAPIGGGQVSTGYSASGRVTDVATGRLMWTARASAPPSSDVNQQLAELSKSVLDAAGTAGLF